MIIYHPSFLLYNNKTMESLIDIRSLCKIYTVQGKPIYALDHVSLAIQQGEILSLLGVNGAGKTTLSSLLATLHPPSSGFIMFRGVSIYDELFMYRNAMGFCPQQPNLDMQLTVEENLFFAGRYFLLEKAIVQSRVSYLMKRFDLQRYAKSYVSTLSGGYKQRLLIARALIHKPELVILDEPTVGLDPDIRHELWDIILELKRDGIAVVLTTHYLEEAEVLADRVCILHKGKVITFAAMKELKEQHKLDKLETIFMNLIKRT